ncbi:hypothetical protein C8P63_1475 [Melghirimyces profundicolus]|uniref:Uncharacterized protein n=1 Tax=Melghirimyces profundicolus TaxID=1242148 RepID=A0A2T6AWE3_9BACL|nr:hypothetical protein [Melghirimyces profundicolus]PTX48133.1 hypothetical protein C8P63_1475 [Melghirimyces profundicolus]
MSADRERLEKDIEGIKEILQSQKEAAPHREGDEQMEQQNWDRLFGELAEIKNRIKTLEIHREHDSKRLDEINSSMSKRLDEINSRMATRDQVKALDRRVDEIAKSGATKDYVGKEVAGAKNSLIIWFVTTFIAVGGLVVAALRLI